MGGGVALDGRGEDLAGLDWAAVSLKCWSWRRIRPPISWLSSSSTRRRTASRASSGAMPGDPVERLALLDEDVADLGLAAGQLLLLLGQVALDALEVALLLGDHLELAVEEIAALLQAFLLLAESRVGPPRPRRRARPGGGGPPPWRRARPPCGSPRRDDRPRAMTAAARSLGGPDPEPGVEHQAAATEYEAEDDPEEPRDRLPHHVRPSLSSGRAAAHFRRQKGDTAPSGSGRPRGSGTVNESRPGGRPALLVPDAKVAPDPGDCHGGRSGRISDESRTNTPGSGWPWRGRPRSTLTRQGPSWPHPRARSSATTRGPAGPRGSSDIARGIPRRGRASGRRPFEPSGW